MLSQSEQKQLRQRDNQQTIEANPETAEVCDDKIDHTALPESVLSDETMNSSSDTNDEDCHKKLSLLHCPSNKDEVSKFLQMYHSGLTTNDIVQIESTKVGCIVTLNSETLVDQIVEQNYRKTTFGDGSTNYCLIDNRVRRHLTKSAKRRFKAVEAEVKARNAGLSNKDYSYTIVGDPKEGQVYCHLLPSPLEKGKDRKELIDRQITIFGLPEESLDIDNPEDYRKSERMAVVKKLAGLIELTEEDFVGTMRFRSDGKKSKSPDDILVTFKEKATVDTIMKNNIKETVLPDGQIRRLMIVQNILPRKTKKAWAAYQKASNECNRKNAELKDPDYIYVLDGDPGFRDRIEVKLVKRIRNPTSTLSDNQQNIKTKPEVCDDKIDQAALPDYVPSDETMNLTSDTTDEDCHKKLLVQHGGTSNKYEVRNFLQAYHSGLTYDDIVEIEEIGSRKSTCIVTLKSEALVDQIMEKNIRKFTFSDGSTKYYLRNDRVRRHLPNSANRRLKAVEAEVRERNAGLSNKDYSYTSVGDPKEGQVFCHLVPNPFEKGEDPKERIDRQIVIHGLPEESLDIDKSEDYRKSERNVVVKKLADLIEITEEAIAATIRFRGTGGGKSASPDKIIVTFKDKATVDTIMKKNIKKTVPPDDRSLMRTLISQVKRQLIDQNIRPQYTQKAMDAYVKARLRCNRKNAELKDPDYIYVLDGDPGFRDSVEVKKVKRIRNPTGTLSDETVSF